jgi:hypothetical protein
MAMSRSFGSSSLTLAADRSRPAVMRLQAGDHAQQGGLAAARGADDDDELAVGDGDVDAVDHRLGLPA